MIRTTEPNYIHYTRIKEILVSEAQWLLASFELRDKNISDSDEYERLLKAEMRLAYRVLHEAFDDDIFEYYCLDDPWWFDELNHKEYYFDKIVIEITDFCSWASDLNYNLPDILVKFVNSSNCNHAPEKQKDQITKDTQVPEVPQEPEKTQGIESTGEEAVEMPKIESPDNLKPSQSSPKKKTKPPEALSEAIEYVYKILLEEGNTEILRPKFLNEFLKRFKEFAKEKGNRNLHPCVVERIETVNPLEEYNTVISKERIIKLPGRKPTVEKSKVFSKQNVSRRLCDLRKKYPLPS